MAHHRQLCVLAAVVATGCSDAKRASLPPLLAGPSLTEAKAGIIVTNMALKEGIKLTSFEQPSTRYDFAQSEWHFFYTLKPPGMPGGHFTVIVDKAEKTKIIGGR